MIKTASRFLRRMTLQSMKFLISLLVLLAVCGCVSSRKPLAVTQPIFTFTVEIHSIRMRDDSSPFTRTSYDLKEVRQTRKGTLVIGSDAHWAVSTTIRNVEGENPLFQVGDEIVFVVHSPSQTFHLAQAEAKGQLMRMDLYGAEGDGRIGFILLYPHIERSEK